MDAKGLLRIALIVVGLIFIFGIYPMSIVWPSGWTWGHGHSHYLLMIIGVYATLGVFLLIASRDPLAHRSLIWFTVWSSLAHAAVAWGLAMLCASLIALFASRVPIWTRAHAVGLAALSTSGSACDNAKIDCTQYTLTATLEGGGTYVKNNLN